MKTKVVYVIVSCEKDAYLEEALISIYSLRKWNSDTKVEIVIDNRTDESLKGKRETILRYIDNKIVVPFEDCWSNHERSRLLKTNLRNIVEGDFLFIDTDTVIVGSLSDIDDCEYNIACVPDKHVPISQHSHRANIDNGARIMGWHVDDDLKYYNSGVVFVRDNDFTHKFWSRWNELWKEHRRQMKSDQPSFARTNEEFGYPIQELDGTWNCQVVENGLKYLQEAKIIHYFASNLSGLQKSPYLFFSKEVTDKIKTNGIITPEIENMISRARSAFTDVCRVISADDNPFMMSSLHGLYLNYPKTFHAFEKVISFYFRVVNKCKRFFK